MLFRSGGVFPLGVTTRRAEHGKHGAAPFAREVVWKPPGFLMQALYLKGNRRPFRARGEVEGAAPEAEKAETMTTDSVILGTARPSGLPTIAVVLATKVADEGTCSSSPLSAAP